MKVAFLFPGQGAQQPGMLHQLPEHPAVVAILEEASAMLGQDVLTLDSEHALQSTIAVQLSLLIAGVAVARALQEENALPDGVAGLSVGAFTAAVSAGVLDFSTALHLVRLRGSLMENAYPRGYGMGAILGLNESQVVRVLAPINTASTPVFLANLNAPRQMVIAGSDAGLSIALNQARIAGASRTERLRVSVPSHCPLMNTVAEQLKLAIKQVPLHPPRIPYISNRGARTLRTQDAIAEDLATCIAYPVRWHDMTTVLFERGARLFVESPPGHVLTSLAAEAFPEARTVAVATSQLQSVVVLIRREQR